MVDQAQIIQQAAQRNGVSPKVLWAIYGAESSWGKAKSSFGLTGDYPGKGTSGNFTKDANRSAEILARLTREQGSLEGALRKYSGGSYGVQHVNDLLRTKPYGSSPYAPLVSNAIGPQAPQAQAPSKPGLPNRAQLALGLLGFGGAGAAAGGDPLAVALQQASQASPTRTAAPSAGSPSSSPVGGGGTGGGIYTQANLGRVDQGVDFRGSGAVPAVGDGVVTRVVGHGGPSGWPGGGFIVYKLTSGPQAGRYVYAAENIVPTVRVGQRVRAGQAIAKALGTSPYTEQGWATNAQGTTLARATSGYSEGQQTPAGKSFRAFLGKLR